MKRRIIGYWLALIGYPDLWGKVPCFGCRWQYLPMVKQTAFQVKIKGFGGYAWVNVPIADFERA